MPPLLPFFRNYFAGRKDSNADIYLISIIASVIMSIWVIATDDLINNDGYDYLTMALAFIHKGPMAIGLNRLWLMPASIAALASTFHITLEMAAYLLSSLAFIIITTTFIAITKELGGDRRAQIFSAIIILTLPYMNEGRSEILRDHLYWALSLIAILYFLRHQKDPTWRKGAVWNIAIATSGLLRSEGFVIMILLPLILLLDSHESPKRKLLSLAQAYSFNIIAAATITTCIATNTFDLSLAMLSIQADVLFLHVNNAINSIQGGLLEKAKLIREAVLEPHAKEFGMSATLAIMALIIVGKTITTLTPLHSLLLVTAKLHTKLHFSRKQIKTIVALLFINLGILVSFVSHHYFLQARYTMGLSFMLLLPAPFILSNLYSIWRTRSADHPALARLFPVVVAAIILMTADILTSLSPSRSYVTDAAAWFQANIPTNCAVTTNESSFPYYANRGLNPSKSYRFWQAQQDLNPLPYHTNIYQQYFTKRDALPVACNARYAAVRTKKGTTPKKWESWLRQENGTLLIEFANKRGDSIQLYKIQQREP